MIRILFILALIFSPAYAQTLKIVNGPIQTTSIDQEALIAIEFLEQINPEDRQNIKFLTTYATPPELRQKCVLTLSFVCHSLAGIDKTGQSVSSYYPLAKVVNGMFVPIRLVPKSKTLWWIDVREFNWTPEAWEEVSKADGYFAEPCINPDIAYKLRSLSGNAMLRADWFIWHGTTINAQKDQKIDIDIYNTLLYAKNVKPKNAEEFKTIWGLDKVRARSFGNEYGTVSLTSRAVARHNRVLMGYRTELGWLYETYDVSGEFGDRNYLESIYKFNGEPPDVSDAGEIIASNALQMQVYALRNGAGDLVDFADPTVARHMTDVTGDTRVRTASSCMDCHANGPIAAENALLEYADFLNLHIPDKLNGQKINQSFMVNRFEDSVVDNQELFNRAMKKVNGLTADENQANFLDMLRWYNEDIDLKQAAFECGIDVEKFIERANSNNVYPVPSMAGRLMLLLHPTKPIKIPRNMWENPGFDGIPGMFQQAMVMVKGLTAIETTDYTKTQQNINLITPKQGIIIMRAGTNETMFIADGQTSYESAGTVIEQNIKWTFIKVNGQIGAFK
jgi:hypothetical protein